ncbi:ABC transporter ATP-binding protein [uncultured Paracoccus sp.]|uniref:ABC transporter ATP-binding protein n=1 Tax=uncultured Paracoccus sp. TaxID=189685 RepID=UPI00260EE52B|nr:ABC transporter ATP-binding protein [uncultured Paracoccus sp.]
MTPPLLSVKDLTVRFKVRGAAPFREAAYLTAVDGVTFDVARGESLGIVGESGSGKSTTALAIARLITHHSGEVRLDGEDLLALKGGDLRRARRKFQFIFQDPYSSLNPRRRAAEIVTEPLASIGLVPKGDRRKLVDDLFEAVGLRPEQQNLFPHQFSGGQRQRIGIARALAPNPALVICDEAVSALDVAVQAQILNLLRRLQRERGLTYLFISHDLGVVQHMCDRIAVMYMGKIVEFADRLSLFNSPLHPYTCALLSAVPSVDPDRRARTKRILITGEPPSPTSPPPGCRFASRCPVAEPRCKTEPPPLREVREGHRVACHLVGDDARAPV